MMTSVSNHDGIDTIFARRIDGRLHLLYETDGTPVTSVPYEWPTLWPVENGPAWERSELSAYYEHPAGIVLTDEEFAKLGVVLKMMVVVERINAT